MTPNQINKILKECKAGLTPAEYSKSNLEFHSHEDNEYVFFSTPNRKMRKFIIPPRGCFLELPAQFTIPQSLSDFAKLFVDSDITCLKAFSRSKEEFLRLKPDLTTEMLLQWVDQKATELIEGLDCTIPQILWILNDPDMFSRWNFKRIHRLQQAAHDMSFLLRNHPVSVYKALSEECIESIFTAFDELCKAGKSVHQELRDTRL